MAQVVHKLPRFLATYPFRITILSSNLAVKTHGKFGNHKGHTCSNELNVTLIYFSSPLLTLTNKRLYSCLFQYLQALPRNQWIGINQGYMNFSNTAVNYGLGARWRTPMMATRF